MTGELALRIHQDQVAVTSSWSLGGDYYMIRAIHLNIMSHHVTGDASDASATDPSPSLLRHTLSESLRLRDARAAGPIVYGASE